MSRRISVTRPIRVDGARRPDLDDACRRSGPLIPVRGAGRLVDGNTVDCRAVGAAEIGHHHGVVGPGLERDVAPRDARIDHDDAVGLPAQLEAVVEEERERAVDSVAGP